MRKFLFLAFLVASSAVWAANPVIVYRGRIVPAANPSGQAFTVACEKRVTCRVYAVAEGGESVFTANQTVKVNKDGSFECVLSSEALTAAIRNGTARYIGVTIGQATSEISPRRRLLPLAQASYAESADTLASASRVKEMKTGSLDVNRLKTAALVVGGTLSTSNATDVAHLARVTPAAGKELRFGRAGATKVLSRQGWKELARGTWRKNEVMATAPSDGIVLLHQPDPPTSGDRILAVPFFCSAGEQILCPCTVKAALAVSFLPFAGE